jgi:hypothetical protein
MYIILTCYFSACLPGVVSTLPALHREQAEPIVYLHTFIPARPLPEKQRDQALVNCGKKDCRIVYDSKLVQVVLC